LEGIKQRTDKKLQHIYIEVLETDEGEKMITISKIAVLGAMECEVEEIKSYLTNLQEQVYKDLKIFTGNINNKFIILSQTGIGKVNAALNCQYIIDTFTPDVIINIGVAGGIGKGLKVGDIVIGNSLIQHDFDVSVLGYAKGYMFTGADKDKPTEYFSDKNIADKFKSSLLNTVKENKIYEGIIATGDQFVSDKKLKEEINKSFNALAVEMEGAAIAQVATRNKIPFLVTRVISDLADGTTAEYQNVFEKETSQILAEAIKKVLADL